MRTYKRGKEGGFMLLLIGIHVVPFDHTDMKHLEVTRA